MTLNLLLTSAISAVTENETDVPKIRIGFEDKHLLTEQESKNLKTCAQNLIAIGKDGNILLHEFRSTELNKLVRDIVNGLE